MCPLGKYMLKTSLLFHTHTLTWLPSSNPTCELSINRLNPVQLSGHPSWEGILRVLGLPAHCSPVRVIPRLTELMQKG